MNVYLAMGLMWLAFISISFAIAFMFYRYAKNRDIEQYLLEETNKWSLVILNVSFWIVAAFFSYRANIAFLAVVMVLAVCWTIANDVLAMNRAKASMRNQLARMRIAQ